MATLSYPAISVPQHYASPIYCQNLIEDFRIEDVSDPYFADPESGGGMSCLAGERGECEHGKTFQHSIGVSQSINGEVTTGLNLRDLLDVGLGLGYEMS